MKLTFEHLPEAVDQVNKKLDYIERLLVKQNKLPESQAEELLTVKETAELLSLTVPTIYSKVSRRELPFMKQSKRLYFSRVELMDYLKAGRKRTNAEIEAEASNYLIKRKGVSDV
jgi:excisionase family DNA binding protein